MLVLKAVLANDANAYEQLLRDADVADAEGIKEMRYLLERAKKMKKE